jgi:hypothetical protein
MANNGTHHSVCLEKVDSLYAIRSVQFLCLIRVPPISGASGGGGAIAAGDRGQEAAKL